MGAGEAEKDGLGLRDTVWVGDRVPVTEEHTVLVCVGDPLAHAVPHSVAVAQGVYELLGERRGEAVIAVVADAAAVAH